MTEYDGDYVTDDAYGDGWHVMLGDSCERMSEIKDESVGLSVHSPPFDSLYTYSPSLRDLGNSSNRGEFVEHYGFIIRELLRVTQPGRIACVHVQQIATKKAVVGVVGLTDFRGQVIQAYVDNGWIFHGEVSVDKDPQVQALRTKAMSLQFQTLERDSAMSRPALLDYVILFRKPGENLVKIKPDVDRPTWIKWARGVWYDIREFETLNTRVAKDDPDERHIAPLQLGLIERCVRLWSNPGELVCSPFTGIGSEGYVSILQKREFVGCELKPSYWKTAVDNLKQAEIEVNTPQLFDEPVDNVKESGSFQPWEDNG